MEPVTVAVGLTALTLGGLFLTRKKPGAFRGDDARVGDRVLASVNAFPPGALPPAINPGAGFVVLDVASVTPTTLTGSFTGFVLQASGSPTAQSVLNLPLPVGPATIQRKDVSFVMRNGKLL